MYTETNESDFQNTLINPSEVFCGVCYRNPVEINPFYGIRYWWKRGKGESESIVLGNQKYAVPRVYEDVLLDFQPHVPEKFKDKARPVHFLGMQNIMKDLIEGLGIQKAAIDQYQAVMIIQGLTALLGNKCHLVEGKMSNSEQYKRARLIKSMLYSDMITLLPNDKRDKEWRQLQRTKSGRIDHPERGSKDLYDAESLAIWHAVTYKCGDIQFSWTE